MHTGYVAAGAGQLFYRKWGSGPKALLAFPGYSNTTTLFQPLARLIAPQYTLYAFDLPHHGQCDWPADKPLHKEDLVTAVRKILAENSHEQCALAAFSLGGRAALSIAEEAPELVARMVLVAPDGLAYNPFYRFVTGTSFGRGLFKSFTEKPQPYQRLLDGLHRLKWVDRSRYHFAKYFIETEEKRKFLYNVWMDLKRLLPDLKEIRKNIRQRPIPVCIFMGEHDHVIPPKLAFSFAKGIPDISVTVLRKGHRLMDHETFEQMARCLNS